MKGNQGLEALANLCGSRNSGDDVDSSNNGRNESRSAGKAPVALSPFLPPKVTGNDVQQLQVLQQAGNFGNLSHVAALLSGQPSAINIPNGTMGVPASSGRAPVVDGSAIALQQLAYFQFLQSQAAVASQLPQQQANTASQSPPILDHGAIALILASQHNKQHQGKASSLR